MPSDASSYDPNDVVVSRTLQQVFSISLSVVGSVINLICILIVINGRLFRERRFTFFLSFLISNFIMCSACHPFLAVFAFQSPAAMKSSIFCRVQGYFMFSIGSAELLNIAFLSVNNYICVVKNALYDRMFTIRNIIVMLVLVWLIYPIIFLFPLLEVWGRFKYDELRFFCNPLLINGSYRNFLAGVVFLLSFPPTMFCYVGILRKLKTAKVNCQQSENAQRARKDNRLLLTIACLITVYAGMNVPFLLLSLVDSEMRRLPLWTHSLALNLGMSSHTVISLIYSMLNQKMKSSFLIIFRNIFYRNNHSRDSTASET